METPIFLLKRIKKKKFKSYYVVWKRTYAVIDPPDAESLNRTMQYGNSSNLLKAMSGKKCLNRTMQYGNGNMFKNLYPHEKV